MISRRLLVNGALVVFAAIGLYLVFGSSKERRVLAVLREMTAALSTVSGESRPAKARRIASACTKHLSENFVFMAPEIGTIEGPDSREQIAMAGSDLGLQVEIKQSDVRVGEGSRARASLLVEVTYRSTGEERSERRSAVVELVERDGDYRIERVEVTEPSKEEPEARP